MNVKVSIFCITYNQEKYVEETLKGFLSQKTNFEWQVHVFDDASTDATPQILKKYAEDYPGVILVTLREKNLGVVRNYFDAARSMKSEYVCFCEGDDYWIDQNKLQKQVDFLDANPTFSACCHRIRVENEISQSAEQEIPSIEEYARKNIYNLKDLLETNYVPSLSIMYRWKFAKNSIPAIPNNVLPCDWIMHLEHAEQGPIKCLPEVMGVYRVWHGGVWSLLSNEKVWSKKNAKKFANFYKYIDKKYGSDHKNIIRYYKARYFKACLYFASPKLFHCLKTIYGMFIKQKNKIKASICLPERGRKVDDCNFVHLQLEVFRRLYRKINITKRASNLFLPTRGSLKADAKKTFIKAEARTRLLVIGVGNSPHTVRWLKNLDETKFEIFLYSVYEIAEATPQEISNQFTIVDTSYPLEEVINFLRPHIVHTLHTQLAAYPLLNYIDSKGKDFYWMHSLWGSDLYFWGKFPDHKVKLQRCLNRLDLLITEGKRDTPIARSLGYTGKIIESIPAFGGIDFSKEQSFNFDAFVPPSSRRIIAVKGYENTVGRFFVAMRALELIKDHLKGFEIHVYLASEASKHIAKLFEYENGIPVKVLDYVPQNQMYQLFSKSRINLGVSLSDGLPSSFIEGMLSGAFPIQTDTSLAGEWITPDVTGMLIPPNDPEIIAQKLLRAITDDELVDEAARKNYETLKRRMDNEIIQEKIRSIYNSISVH